MGARVCVPPFHPYPPHALVVVVVSVSSSSSSQCQHKVQDGTPLHLVLCDWLGVVPSSREYSKKNDETLDEIMRT